MGAAGREPAKKVVETYYSSRKNYYYKGCTAYLDFRELLEKEKDLDAVYQLIGRKDLARAPVGAQPSKAK